MRPMNTQNIDVAATWLLQFVHIVQTVTNTTDYNHLYITGDNNHTRGIRNITILALLRGLQSINHIITLHSS